MREWLLIAGSLLFLLISPAFGWAQDQAVKKSGHRLKVVQTDEAIKVLSGDSTVFVYNITAPSVPRNINPVFRRNAMIHPLYTPGGKEVTAVYPASHAHQSGLFSAWVQTEYDGKFVDFWNLAKKLGRVVHDKVERVFESENEVGFVVTHIHRITGEKENTDVLSERWMVTVYSELDGNFCFDIQTEQSALTDLPLKIKKYHYGGMAIRGLSRWLLPEEKKGAGQAAAKQQVDEFGNLLEPSGMVNNLGSKRIKGNHQPAKWVSLWGQVDGKQVSATMMCHPENFRSPQPARLHPRMPYFCFAPCVNESFVIDRNHPFRSRYRFFVADAEPDPKWLNQKWEEFAEDSP